MIAIEVFWKGKDLPHFQSKRESYPNYNYSLIFDENIVQVYTKLELEFTPPPKLNSNCMKLRFTLTPPDPHQHIERLFIFGLVIFSILSMFSIKLRITMYSGTKYIWKFWPCSQIKLPYLPLTIR